MHCPVQRDSRVEIGEFDRHERLETAGDTANEDQDH